MRDLKRLLRYAIGLLSLALMFNVAGYFYINYQSRENDRQEENEKVASNLQTLCQQVAKDMLYLLADPSPGNRAPGLSDELQRSLREFETKQSFLRSEIDRPKAQKTEALQGLDLLFTRITPFYNRLDSIGHVLLDDTAPSGVKASVPVPYIQYNESSYLEGMQDITRIYHNVDNGFVNKIFFVNTGVLTSLIFAIIVMAVFVIVPVITQGDNNYSALRKRDNQLQALSAATHLLIGNGDFKTVVAEAITILGRQIDTDRISIYEFKPPTETLPGTAGRVAYWCREGRDVYPAGVEQFPLLSMNAITEVLGSNGVFVSSTADIASPEIREWLQRTGTSSIASIPIFVREKLWGLLGLANYKDGPHWTDADFFIMRSFAGSLGAAIERVMIQEQLILAKDAAEAGSRARSEFMANISHELRTPMNGIIGFSDLLLTTSLPEVQREYVQHVSKSAYSLLSLINDILDFSKIEAGKFFFEHVSFNLEDLVGEAVDIVSIKAFEKQLELICDCGLGSPTLVWGDPLRIRQILINLLGNAIKFTETGEVSITFTRAETPIERNGKQYLPLSIAVKDTGIGIPAEKLTTIFESFTQADSTTTRKYGGTGLGLTISKNLAEMMGGMLLVESVPGQGSTFTLQLEPELAGEEPADPQPEMPLHHVLVVDDNQRNCRLLEKFFHHFGIGCTWCAGDKALANLREHRTYDLIITDHEIPGINAVDTPTILMLSSLERSQQRQQAARAGIEFFLSKPVKPKELQKLIASIFAKTTDAAGNHALRFEKFDPGAIALVVEDEPVNMMLISEVLRNMGVEVLKATNGEDALDKLADHIPTIIFMDVNMPVMDGFTATHAIRQLPRPQRNIPIVALTADATTDDKEKCLQAGMDTFISKPFRLEEIAGVLKKYLS